MTDEHGRLTTGTVLGRYRLEALLGTGGMASVWKARDERLGRTVAVKVLSETLALDRDYVKRFKREAQIAARLSHPNLVPVFDFGAGGPRPYLVSEFVEGGTLADRLEDGGPIDSGRLARQLLAALGHIHAAGVVHRDVKPANVLIDPDGHSRLTDFGVAQPNDAAPLTETGKVIGTLGYMAPEVQRGEPASERSDLYSAGVVLEESLDESAPPELSRLVDSLTSEDPRQRPPSAAAALESLDTAPRATRLAVTEPLPTEAQGLAAGVAAPGRSEAKPSRRARALALAALLGVVVAGFALAGAVGGGSDGADPIETKAAKQRPTPKETTVTVAAQPTTPATTAAAPTEMVSADPCEAPGDWMRSMREQRKAAEQAVADKDARKLLKEEWKSREHDLKDRLKECGDEGWSGGEGHGNSEEGD